MSITVTILFTVMSLWLWFLTRYAIKKHAEFSEFQNECDKDKQYKDNYERGTKLAQELTEYSVYSHAYVKSNHEDLTNNPWIYSYKMSSSRMTLEEAEADLNRLLAKKHRSECVTKKRKS